MRSKAFFINGGAGRVICSIPALEKYAETHDDFIIVAEGGMNFFKGHPVLHKHTYDHWHKGLFEQHLKDRDMVTPEPYRMWHYYNQKCSLAQAFDMEINGLEEPRDLPAPNIKVLRSEGISALNTIEEIKSQTGKDKVVVIQPFGRGIVDTGGYLFDPTARSFNLGDISKIITDLKKDYTVIVMSEFHFETTIESEDQHAVPQVPDIRFWSGIIEQADHFLGCDSVGQHIAKAVGTTATVVTGSTYPINISYPNDSTFDVIDVGEGKRTFSPIRLTAEDEQEMLNDGCMDMNDAQIKSVIDSCRKRLGKPVKATVKKKKEDKKQSCCDTKQTKGFGS
jgi:hypothetical protein